MAALNHIAKPSTHLRLGPWQFRAGPDDVGDDLLKGAGEIAQFLFGDAAERRRVYYLAESGQLPIFRLGGLCARKSTLLVWLADQERAAMGLVEKHRA